MRPLLHLGSGVRNRKMARRPHWCSLRAGSRDKADVALYIDLFM
jgi:hypothetical protein